MEEIISRLRVVAVIRSESLERCVEIARSCHRGGIKIIEITYTVPEAIKAIELLVDELKDAFVGAGTVLTLDQFAAAVKSGARYVVSPHLSSQLANYSRETGTLYLPGIMTPSEYFQAIELGCSMVKVFPGDVLSPNFIKSLRGPFPEARCVVSGGVNLSNIDLWFAAGATAVGVGSELTRGTPQEIQSRATQYVEKIESLS